MKSFRARTMDFGRGSAFTMPSELWQSACFGATGSTNVIVRPRTASTPLTDAFERLASLIGFGNEAANEAFCNSPNLPRFGPWDVQGNVQVAS